MGARERSFIVNVDGQDVPVSRKSTRKTRNGGLPQEQKEKFVREAAAKIEYIKKFVPTPSQEQAIDIARNNTLSWIVGVSGSGKSTCVLWDYCQEYLRDNTKKIYVIKGATEVSMDKIGFLPFGLDEKMSAHMVANRKILEDFLGAEKVAADLNKRIFLLPPNYLLGQTLEGLILIEESQQLQPNVLKLILERTGSKGSRVCVVGDASQLYTDAKEAKLRNGLTDGLKRFFNEDMSPKYPDVGHFEFNIEDVKRSEIVKTILRAYADYQ